MIRKLSQLGDQLLAMLMPGAEAQADTCYYSTHVDGCYRTKRCYPNPTGGPCLLYFRNGCGDWYYAGYC